MQTTLLGLAIALILALVAALVGPHFVNWNDYRCYFESEASRIIGLDVRVAGDVEVRVLPFPWVSLADIEIGPRGQSARLRAGSLDIEFGLGPLMRGELRAVELRLAAPRATIGFNSLGHVDWPEMTLAAETLAIDRLRIDDGHLTLADAGSGLKLVLDRLSFAGSVRSLRGPVRGSGVFLLDGESFEYRIGTGRFGDDGVKIKLAVEAPSRPLSVELDGALAGERRAPQFNGTVKLSRPAGAVRPDGTTVAQEPLQLTAQVAATPQTARFENVALQYGPEERAVRLAGAATFRFGAEPLLHAALAARQIDLDRLLATPREPRRTPAEAVRQIAETLTSTLRPSFLVALDVSVDAVTLGGALVQNVGADLRTDGRTWRFEKLEFRAPGFAQTRLSGRLDRDGSAPRWNGAIRVDANDPRTLVAWLIGKPAPASQIRPLRLSGELSLGPERLAIDRFAARFDQGTLDGRLVYVWPRNARAARLEADLKSSAFDLDAVLQFGSSVFAGSGLQWPREIALGLEFERARLFGFDAAGLVARLGIDRNGIVIERVAVTDIGGASVAAAGRIVTGSAGVAEPGGRITIDLDARNLAAVTALADRIAPRLGAALRRVAASPAGAKLRFDIDVEPGTAGDARSAKLAVAGTLASFEIGLKASASGRMLTAALGDVVPLPGTTDVASRARTATLGEEIRLDASLAGADGGALLKLLGLDRFAVGAAGPGRLQLSMHGEPGRDASLEGSLTAGVLDARASGTIRLPDDGQPPTIQFKDVSGTMGASRIKGRLTLLLDDAPRIVGAIEADAIDAAAVLAAALGLPARNGETDPIWSQEPFKPFGPGFVGRVELKARRASFAQVPVAGPLRAVMSFGTTQLLLEDIAGEMAGGRLTGRLAFVTGHNGLTMQARLALNGADAAAVLGRAPDAPLSGRLSLEADVTGTGLSGAALVGSLSGNGRLAIDKAQIAGLNPRVFAAVIRAVDLGMASDVERVRDFVSSSLQTGMLSIPHAETAVIVNNGRARLAEVAAQSGDVNVVMKGSVVLATGALNAAITLSGAPDAPGEPPPALTVALNGPFAAPQRHVDADALAAWLALRAVARRTQQLETVERAATIPMSRIGSAPVEPQASAAQPDAETANAAPVIAAPPLPPAISILPAPRPRPATMPAPRPAARSPAAGLPLDLLGGAHR